MIKSTLQSTTVRVTVKEVALYLDLQSKRRTTRAKPTPSNGSKRKLAAKLEALANAHVGPVRKGKYTLALARNRRATELEERVHPRRGRGRGPARSSRSNRPSPNSS